MKVLASLVDAENRILVKGFLDKVSLYSSPSPCMWGDCPAGNHSRPLS